MPTLQWLGREEAVLAADNAPFRLLEHAPDLSAGDADTENLIIRGDNLDALKAMLPVFAGRVKCIAIDPPYNTGSAFEQYDDNIEHSTWLSLMYPRLRLLHEFLRDDGILWVCIDDSECHYLKALLDEIFGRKNFLTTFVWKKSYGGGAKAKYFVGLHEYVLCYAKNLAQLPDLFLPPDEKVMKYYKYKDAKVATRGPYRLQPLATTSNDERPNLRYPIVTDDGEEVWPVKQWQWSKVRVETARANDQIVFTKHKGNITVSYKQYLKDESGEERKRKPTTIIEGAYTQHGTYESMALFGLERKFQFPKPEALMQQLIECSTEKGEIILDSFAGSGTTLAVAHKMGRRYIGVEMGEHAETHCVPRLRKVIEGEQGGISKDVEWKGGGGFRFMRLGPPVFDETGVLNPDIRFPNLAAHIWFSETHTGWCGKADSPLLGIHKGTAYYLLFNGILGDRRPDGGNVLNTPIFKLLPTHTGPKVIYGEWSQWRADRLRREGITFKMIPYEIKVR